MSSDIVPPDKPLSKKQWKRFIAAQKERQRLEKLAEKMFGPQLRRLGELEIASAHGMIPAALELTVLREKLREVGVIK